MAGQGSASSGVQSAGWVVVATPEHSDHGSARQPRRRPKFMRDMTRELETFRLDTHGHMSFLQLQNQQMFESMETLGESLRLMTDRVLALEAQGAASAESIQQLEARVDSEASAAVVARLQAVEAALASKADEASTSDRIQSLQASVDVATSWQASTNERLQALQSVAADAGSTDERFRDFQAEIRLTNERIQSLQAGMDTKTEAETTANVVHMLQGRIDSKADLDDFVAEVASNSNRLHRLHDTVGMKAEEAATSERIQRLEARLGDKVDEETFREVKPRPRRASWINFVGLRTPCP